MILFVLVMSEYDHDPTDWIYSKSASTREALEILTCYDDPPNSLPRADFEAVAQWPLPSPLQPCDRPQAAAIEGTIYELRPNA